MTKHIFIPRIKREYSLEVELVNNISNFQIALLYKRQQM